MSAPALTAPVRVRVRSHISIRRRIKDRFAALIFMISFGIATVPLIWLLWVVVARGWRAVVHASWWTHSLRGVLPDELAGGVYHALYGTLVQAGVAALLAVPLGLMTAIYLVEYGSGWWARLTTFMVDVLAGCRRSSPRCSSSVCGSPPWASSRARWRSRWHWCC